MPALPYHAVVVATLQEQGKSKSWLSQRSGVSRNTIDNWAKQPRAPQAGTVVAVAKVLGIHPKLALQLAGVADVIERYEIDEQDGVPNLASVPTDVLMAELRRRIPD